MEIRMSFHHRVLIALLTLCWVLVGTFMVFQYQREKKFKTELLNTQLQMYNARILDDLKRGDDINSIITRVGTPLNEMRVTLIDRSGKVIYDNNDNTPFPSTNHNNRPEIIESRQNGAGYIVERRSESDDTDYFYSARLGDNGIVVRIAAPYTHTLQTFLKADRTFLWIMVVMTLMVSFAGYFITRRISLSISRLSTFADKAQKGERIFNDESFPDDELGSIAGNIVRLYVQRDLQHKEAMAQEQDKIRLKKQLTNNINHELKTPVASILVCTDILIDHPDIADEKRKEFLTHIHTNAIRLSALLNDVATITRMDDGAYRIEKEPLDISKLVADIVAEERLHTDMKISTDIPPLTINANRSLIESIFRNLIVNAISYSGGSEISISADNDGNFIFRDNGTGIPDEHLPHIFERFYRIDKGRSREHGGTGLGLSIVRNAVAIHGGSISVRNEGGLRFDFRIS